MKMDREVRSDIVSIELIKKALDTYLESRDYELIGFTSHPGTLKGDNYMGDLFTLEVDVRVGNGQVKTLHWMVKTLKPSKILIHW